ncbi:MAG: hypothetical protein CMC08_06010 [Flavobacteriaceae bacterium]|nr:hypothetical protein [Flavobacteriaceae bacterium]
MATYKKRGYKPKNKAEKDVQVEENSATAEVFNTLDEGASKTEAWVEKNQKIIFSVIGVIAVAVLGYLAFQEFIQKPREVEGMNDMYQAQTYFEQALAVEQGDSLYNLALNGGQGQYGFLDIIDNYGGTNAANLAHYYAGMAYLQTNDYQNAISQLDEFESDDAILTPLAKGAIGDAFVQLDQSDKALDYYEEAASMNTNEFTTPRFLLKAGITALNLGKTDAALAHFKSIEDNYPNSQEAAKAMVYVGKAEAMKQQ